MSMLKTIETDYLDVERIDGVYYYKVLTSDKHEFVCTHIRDCLYIRMNKHQWIEAVAGEVVRFLDGKISIITEKGPLSEYYIGVSRVVDSSSLAMHELIIRKLSSIEDVKKIFKKYSLSDLKYYDEYDREVRRYTIIDFLYELMHYAFVGVDLIKGYVNTDESSIEKNLNSFVNYWDYGSDFNYDDLLVIDSFKKAVEAVDKEIKLYKRVNIKFLSNIYNTYDIRSIKKTTDKESLEGLGEYGYVTLLDFISWLIEKKNYGFDNDRMELVLS